VLVDAERAGVRALEGLIEDEDDVAIAAVTVAELVVGVELADERRKEQRRAFVDAVLNAVSIEPYEIDVARAHGVLLAHTQRTGRPRGAHDLIIAATARARKRAVLSPDHDGFADLPEVLLRSPT
jgi:tRNA(fMet)-specific endonuclease VapC